MTMAQKKSVPIKTKLIEFLTDSYTYNLDGWKPLVTTATKKSARR